MITVHALENSRAHRILWLLEEMGVAYTVISYARDPRTLAAPRELRDIHPLGKSPVVTEGDVVIAESGAIIEYLIGRYGGGRLQPAPASRDRLRYSYWMHYAEGSLMPYLLLKLIFSKVKSGPMPFFVKPIARKIADTVGSQFVDPNITRHLTFLADHLAKREWFAGSELTAADVQMSFPLEGAVARAGSAVPARLAEQVKKFQARPAYKRALEKGGPYELMG
jgi:glutathione S-transferase